MTPFGAVGRKIRVVTQRPAAHTALWQMGRFGVSPSRCAEVLQGVGFTGGGGRAVLALGPGPSTTPTAGPVRARPVVLSPHFDDAVFSCFAVVRAGADVITVCGGLPEPGDASGHVVGQGFADTRAYVAARAAEDTSVLCAVGAGVARWSFPDLADDPRVFVHADALRARMAALMAELGPGGTAYAPAGIGGHPNHLDVRDALLAAWRDVPADQRPTVGLYADTPYAVARYGEARLDNPKGWLPRELRPVARQYALTVRGVRLSTAEAERKAAAMRGYATQFAHLADAFGAAMTDRSLIAREWVWSVAPLSA